MYLGCTCSAPVSSSQSKCTLSIVLRQNHDCKAAILQKCEVLTHMMRHVCIHEDDIFPRRKFKPMNISRPYIPKTVVYIHPIAAFSRKHFKRLWEGDLGNGSFRAVPTKTKFARTRLQELRAKEQFSRSLGFLTNFIVCSICIVRQTREIEGLPIYHDRKPPVIF